MCERDLVCWIETYVYAKETSLHTQETYEYVKETYVCAKETYVYTQETHEYVKETYVY